MSADRAKFENEHARLPSLAASEFVALRDKANEVNAQLNGKNTALKTDIENSKVDSNNARLLFSQYEAVTTSRLSTLANEEQMCKAKNEKLSEEAELASAQIKHSL